MKKLLFLLYIIFALIFVGLTMTSCGNVIKVHTSEDYVTREIEVTEKFSAIEACNTTDIEYSDGPAKIILSAPDNLINRIEVFVKDGVLFITEPEDTRKVFNGMMRSKLTVSYPGVYNFGTSGTGDINIDTVKADSLYLNTYGTGDIKGQRLSCNILKATSCGTGDIEVKELNCREAFLNTDGTGDIDVYNINANAVTANTGGTGDVTLTGKCRTFEYSVNGSGDINAKRLKVGEK